MDVAALFDTHLTPFQRLIVTWLFIIVGLVIAVQVSQTEAERPLRWARFTKETRSVKKSLCRPVCAAISVSGYAMESVSMVSQ